MVGGDHMEDIPDQIGGRLLQAREKAGLTVDDIIFRTGIPRSVIMALEAGDFSVFSSPTYARSFLSQYSDFLNVEAHVWLDALEPASFSATGIARSLLEAPAPQKEADTLVQGARGGWLSALGILAVSCGMVYVAMKGYEFFEARFGTDLSPAYDRKVEVKIPGRLPVPANLPPLALEPKPAPAKPEDELAKPPPRAVIVRLPH